MPERRTLRSRLAARLLTALAGAAIVTLLILSGSTARQDASVYDTLARPSAPEGDARIVMVAIDEASLSELGKWPWSRRLHARLIDRLTAAGVRGIALDVLLSEPALFDPEGDALLAGALNLNGKVVLPVFAEARPDEGTAVELMPIPEFAASAAALGHVDRVADADGQFRSLHLRAGLATPHWPALALAMHLLDKGGEAALGELPGLRIAQPPVTLAQRWVRDYKVLLPYPRADRQYPMLSYADVVAGRVPDAQLRGRWILVSVTAPGMGAQTPEGAEGAEGAEDVSVTPLSAIGYHARALDTLINGQAIVPLAPPAQVLLSIMLACLPLLVMALPRGPGLGTAILVTVVATLVLSWLLLRWAHLWFAPMPALLVLGLGALMWTLKRLRQGRHRAQSDPLTGLANRALFEEQLRQELRLAPRSVQPLSLLLLQVDQFGPLGERHGTGVADIILKTLGDSLRGCARRPRDLVARLEADRFAVLLPETTPHAAAAIATTVHVDLANHTARASSDPDMVGFTISIGIHTVRSEDETLPSELIAQAEAARAQAGLAGGNRTASYSELKTSMI